jgi:hypothetical protein
LPKDELLVQAGLFYAWEEWKPSSFGADDEEELDRIPWDFNVMWMSRKSTGNG